MSATVPPWVATLAAVGLRATPDLPRTGWSARLDQVTVHGLVGLLAEAWRADAVVLDDDDLDRLADRLHAEADLAVRLEAEILRLQPVLDRSGAVVLKGPVLAHGAYPDPSWRPFTDLDLLVPAQLIPATLERLIGFGYRRPRPDPSPGFLVRVAKATALEHSSGLVVDLHRTLATGNPGAWIDVADIVRNQIVVQAGAVAIPAPAWPAHLVEISLHAMVGDGMARGLSLRDVVQVASHPSVITADVIDLARRWRVDDVLRAVVVDAHRQLGVPVPPGFGWKVASGDDPVSPVLGAGSSGRRSARLRTDELRRGGLRRRATLLRALLAPSPAFLRWKYGDGRLDRLYRRRWHDLRARRRQAQEPSHG